MKLQTTAEVISFAKKLEDDSAGFYENLQQQYARDEEVFLSFIRENGKYVLQFQRAYYSVISDAIEGCFAFAISPEEYSFDTAPPDKANYAEALDQALAMEARMIKFYSDAAEQSKSLMADVPRTFALIAKKRSIKRIPELQALINKGD
jgi:rubrerythrin